MIEYRNGDLLKQEDVNVIVHQCNCFNTMGAGIARAIAIKYPRAKKIDSVSIRGDRNKLGTYSWVRENDKMIVNMYSQYRYGRGTQTDYDAMRTVLCNLREHLNTHMTYNKIKKFVVGLPYNMGCGLAGGDWEIVKGIIEEIFEDAHFNVVICKLEE